MSEISCFTKAAEALEMMAKGKLIEEKLKKERSEKMVSWMPKGIKKINLATKICLRCHRPFTWRKKWEKVWDQVKYCSDKCKK